MMYTDIKYNICEMSFMGKSTKTERLAARPEES